VLVAPVERAEEVAAVAPVEREHPGGLHQRSHDEPGTVLAASPGAEPR
jgi:hypothetical protein